MKKILWLSALLAAALIARDNPFFSTEENGELPLTNNKTAHKPPLNSLTYNFPDQARVLKEASFTFQNIDGTIETRRVEIDQTIDWHNPLVLSQSSNTKSNGTNTASSNANFDFIRFNANQNRLVITSSDPMIRYFTMTEPNALAVDFQHKTPFTHYSQKLSGHPYAHVKVSNHGKFARAIITLDGRYSCTITPSGQEIVITCK